ncbi:methyltransferase domain-containing protein [bacterium]|nr:methyltransferase domain-containing protein [bacterium]
MRPDQTFEFFDNGPSLAFTCRACRARSAAPVYARIAAAQMADGVADWVWCAACGSANAPLLQPPDYEDDQPISPQALKYYIEQNAGIDVLAGLIAGVRREGPTRVLDVGCGLGFLLDYARSALGWEVQGVDPSTFAREGRRLLGLPIASEYLSAENAATYAADVIVCSEIIEHLDDPDPFLDVLKQALRPGGVLVMTTPSATGARPDAGADRNMLAFGPGQHLVSYSRDGLIAALRRAGFRDVEVRERSGGVHLLAGASMRPGQLDLSQRLDGTRFRGWLERRAQEVGDPALRRGFLGRWLKLAVNAGEWKEAGRAAAALREVFRLDGFDLDAPAKLTPPDAAGFVEFAPLAPCNMGSVLFYLGRLAERTDDAEHARAYFEASIRFGRALNRHLAGVPALDLETAEYISVAEGRSALWTIPADPARAAKALEGSALSAGDGIPGPMFAHAIGVAASAGRDIAPLAAVFRRISPTLDGASRYNALIAFGLAAMRHDDPEAAATWYAAACTEADAPDARSRLREARIQSLINAVAGGRLADAARHRDALDAAALKDDRIGEALGFLLLHHDRDPLAAADVFARLPSGAVLERAALAEALVAAVGRGDGPGAVLIRERMGPRPCGSASAEIALGLLALNHDGAPGLAGLHLIGSGDPDARGLILAAQLACFCDASFSGRFDVAGMFLPALDEKVFDADDPPPSVAVRTLGRAFAARALLASLKQKQAEAARAYASRAKAFELSDDIVRLLDALAAQ